MHKQVTNDDNDADADYHCHAHAHARSISELPKKACGRGAVVARSFCCALGTVITFMHMAIDLLGHINNMALIGRPAALGRTD